MAHENEMMLVTCRCGHRMKVPAVALGKTVKCVKCAERILLSQENTQSPRAPRPQPGPRPEAGAEPASPLPLHPGDKRVGQLLIEEGLITEQHLQEALDRQARHGGKLFENLIELRYLEKKALHTFLSKQSGVPSIDLRHYEIPPDLISLIPREFAQKNVVLPIDKMGKLLTVGMACPLDTATIAELECITGLKVKAMLCAFDDIHVTIDRYYPGEPETYVERHAPAVLRVAFPAKPTGIKREEVAAALASLDILPALAGTIDEVNQAAASAQHAIRDVAGIVCADPSVTAVLLSVANCSPYGLPGQVANINVAVTLLGVAGTQDVARRFENAPTVDPASLFDSNAFWLRSMFCATATMSIAKASDRGEVGDAYTAGLLHEIGRLALAMALPEAYARVAPEMPDPDRIRAEENALGVAHPEAGYFMMRKWKLPPAVCVPVRHHHAPEETRESHDLVAIVSLAAAMADAFMLGASLDGVIKSHRRVMKSLLIDGAAITRVHEKTCSTLDAIAQQRS